MKQEISLISFLAARGFDIDPHKSWSTGTVMVRGDTKLTVGKGKDGNWCFISREGAGSIFDFLRLYEPGTCPTIGHARKELRPLLAGGLDVAPRFREASAAIRPAQAADFGVQAAFYAADPLVDGVNIYLNTSRGLPPSLLAKPFLFGRIRVESATGHRNVLFPHFDISGAVCAYISLNQGFKQMAAGSVKGLFGTIPSPDDQRLVIAESVLDGLSYLHAHGDENARMISFEGTMNTQQPELIASAIRQLSHGEIIAAVDNDAGGDKFAAQLQAIFQSVGRSEIAFRRDSPLVRGLDWNDQIRHRNGPELNR